MKYELDKVPPTFGEALASLVKSLEPEDRAHLKSNGADHTHFGGGLWLRNNWSLWDPETPLAKWFRENLGLGHADDMSGILMESLARIVKGQPIELEKQAEEYRQFWRRQGVDPLTLEQKATA